MKRLNLDNHSPFHKTGHTSKGDQRKWKVGDRWYKADYMGYESLAEVLDKEEMIMPASFIEKAGMELVGTFVKNVGLEAGKRVIYGKPQKPKENHLTEIKEVKESVEIVNCSYGWLLFLPVLAGETTFALAGTGAAAMVYTVNSTVLLGGLIKRFLVS